MSNSGESEFREVFPSGVDQRHEDPREFFGLERTPEDELLRSISAAAGNQTRSESETKKSRKLNLSTWTSEEDELLLRLVAEFGAGSWHTLASDYFELRKTGPQLRSRYVDVLNPSRVRGQWTEEEDKKLVELQQKYGNRWTKIRDHFDGRRVANDLKNRFRLLQKSVNTPKEPEETK
eukprot:CAMPEP_0182443536 /NCGR_PEP_ID=MMETSP1172-20130603/2248_1 /TAXON_ID=708627 /ORGANISM="Timspurckia oligopyrenoides, Strain CCMP3278" /LENGTH=177 /DNA_ID=CAMNT_0024638851 /DNA_START=171 /DNA_END=704 /DNA_ORIENTATION=+